VFTLHTCILFFIHTFRFSPSGCHLFTPSSFHIFISSTPPIFPLCLIPIFHLFILFFPFPHFLYFEMLSPLNPYVNPLKLSFSYFSLEFHSFSTPPCLSVLTLNFTLPLNLCSALVPRPPASHPFLESYSYSYFFFVLLPYFILKLLSAPPSIFLPSLPSLF